MRIVFIGDIYGRSGREALQKYLPKIHAELKPDFVIVNADNAANGHGINDKQVKEFYEWGVDCITGGDHVWDQRQIISYIKTDPKLLRPLNCPKDTPGNGIYKIEKNGMSCLVVHALGRVFIDPLDDPFAAIKNIVDQNILGQNVDAIFVDFHAEATSEKMAMGHYLDGKVTAVVGSHTHIPTADHHILSGGTAYQTDAGMCGDYDSVIGAKKEIPLRKFITKVPGDRMIPASGEATLCGTLVIAKDNGLAESIHPIRLGGKLETIWPEG